MYVYIRVYTPIYQSIYLCISFYVHIFVYMCIIYKFVAFFIFWFNILIHFGKMKFKSPRKISKSNPSRCASIEFLPICNTKVSYLSVPFYYRICTVLAT